MNSVVFSLLVFVGFLQLLLAHNSHLSSLVRLPVGVNPNLLQKNEAVEVPDPTRLWHPKQGTREEFLLSKGLGRIAHDRVRQKIRQLKLLAIEASGRKFNEPISSEDDTIGDVVYTEKQLDSMIAAYSSRQKRKVRNFNEYPEEKWELPIPYMFDGTHTTEQMDTIRRAVAHVEQHSCITFMEATSEDEITHTNAYLLFITEDNACWSYIGKQFIGPQPVNLHPNCLYYQIGIAVHEIGHAMGLFHEQSRPDRDDFVEILENNVIPEYLHNFNSYSETEIDTLGVPYDYSSVMHYSPESFSVNSSLYNTICPVYPGYLQHMGQDGSLSFLDIQAINRAYCDDTCNTTLACEHNGFPDPQNCNICKCPDGFGGTLCDTVEPSDSVCNIQEPILMANNTEQCISSPGYDIGLPYPVMASCNWHIEAEIGSCINISFPSDMYFIRFVDSEVCNHWVEIKHKQDMGYPGMRFCERNRRPDFGNGSHSFVTDSNLAVVTFRSYFNYTRSEYLGFKLCFFVGDCSNSGSEVASSVALNKCVDAPNGKSLGSINAAGIMTIIILLAYATGFL